MNKIKKIDERNLTANVYAGVTFEQLAAELAKSLRERETDGDDSGTAPAG